jgi:UDP-N-acetylmuramoyl-tripeptide--D-alanyl-D-alanine ligase
VRVTAYRATDDGGGVVGIQLARELVDGKRPSAIEVALRLAGATSALNCAAALAGTIATLGRPIADEELKTTLVALGRVQPVEGRMVILRVGPIKAIDDSYNANPRSVKAALKTAREMASREGSRLVVALGDMLELGELSKDSHREMIGDVADANPAVFIAVGPCTGKELIASAGALSNACEVVIAADAAKAAQRLSEIAQAGDLVLIKGSRGMGMELLVRQLENSVE